MRRWLPVSLRGQVLLAVLLALAVAQGIGAGIAVLTRQQAVRAAQLGDALDRAAALTYVIERTPADLHANILRAAETPLSRLAISPTPLVAVDGEGLEGPRRRLAYGLEGTDHVIRMTMTTTSGKVVTPQPDGPRGRRDADDDDDEGDDWADDWPDDWPDDRRDGGPGDRPDDRRDRGRGVAGDGDRDDGDRDDAGAGPGGAPPPGDADARRDRWAGAPPEAMRRHEVEHRGPVPRRNRPPQERPDREALKVSIGLAGGQWLNADIRFPRPERGLPVLSLISFALAAMAIGLALWIALARLLGPLRGLATAAEGLGRGEAYEPLPAKGPSEMRALTEAFNHMQQRLHRMVSDRTQMLAALGHDLRSPLTALRVQTEMVDDDETREQLLTSLAEMQSMVDQTLTYARGVWTAEAMDDVDAGDLVADLADEAGVPAALPDERVMLRLRPATIRRALRNLIDNARRYGGPDVTVALKPGPDTVAIEIADRGPGIPPEALARVFDPFVRLEASRSRETGGTGLGLSIARSIVQAHGGEVTLSNRDGGGLLATVTLPRPRPDGAAG